MRNIAFSDPVYGAKSPVASMANYHVHILYHLPQLEYIDGLHISTRQVAEQAEVNILKTFSSEFYFKIFLLLLLGDGNQKENVVSYEI